MAMTSKGIFFAGVLAGAAVCAVTAQLFPQSEPARAATHFTADTSSPPRQLQQRDMVARDCRTPVREQENCGSNALAHLSSQVGPDREHNVSQPEADSGWNALVGGMLEWEVEHRSGQKLTAEKKDRLISTLSRLREASLALQQAPAEPCDSAELRDRLTQSIALVQADQAFRNELGLGIAEFLHGLDPTTVEDVSPARAEP
jgi:hypothetical protein